MLLIPGQRPGNPYQRQNLPLALAFVWTGGAVSESRRLRLMSCLLAGLAMAAGLMLLPSGASARQGAVQCERCHGDREFLAGRATDATADERLFVPDTMLHGTRHETLVCGSCHTSYDDAYPHQPNATTATCASCHEPEERDWLASAHSMGGATADGETPDCMRCHGVHRVLGPENRASPIHALNEAALCGECHSDSNILEAYFADPADSVARSAVSRYQETVHGLAIEQAGLVVAATCSDCHRPHRVLPSDSTHSSVSRDSIPRTCGTCHEGVVEDYRSSSHGQAFESGEMSAEGHEAPVCNTCHSAHGVAPTDQPWKAGVIEECGVCHERLYETYFDTYHGKVTRLGGEIAARCSDCHTPHLNLPAADPASTVHPSNRVETCAACHSAASAGFITYLPHADPRDRERFPLLYWTWLAMTSLLVGVFVFFGAHTVLWLLRTTADRIGGGEPTGHGSRAGAPAVISSTSRARRAGPPTAAAEKDDGSATGDNSPDDPEAGDATGGNDEPEPTR